MKKRKEINTEEILRVFGQIHNKMQRSKIKEGLNIEAELRTIIENDINENDESKFRIFGDKTTDFKQLVLSDMFNDMLYEAKITFVFKARLDREFFNFPSNVKTKEVDVITLGNGCIDLYYFKKGNGIDGSCNSDTTISESIPNQLDMEKEAIHFKCGIPMSNLKGHIVVFTTKYPTWKSKTKNEVVYGGDLCDRWGIGDKFETIKEKSKSSASFNYNDEIEDLKIIFEK